MLNSTLVIMAAGLGTRFKGEIKQLASVGPNGETLMEYSICGAKEVGFNKVVFIIRRDIEEEFKEKIGKKVAKIMPVEYLFQDATGIPEKYLKIKRVKPWGTVHTLLACKNTIQEPFCVINADDFYGKEAFYKVYHYLQSNPEQNHFCMAGYILKNTMSENGSVNRGICQVDENRHLVGIREVKAIQRENDIAVGNYKNQVIELSLDSYVSMNLWGFKPSIFKLLEREFLSFLENMSNEQEDECYLSTAVDQFIKNNEIDVALLETSEQWFGMTYIEDKAFVKNCINQLIQKGEYKNNLYED